VPSVLISSPEELEIITVNLNFLNRPITLCTLCELQRDKKCNHGYSNELKEMVNCVKQNWDGSSFLGRLAQQEDFLWSMD